MASPGQTPVTGELGRIIALRLAPGTDLLRAIAALPAAGSIEAGFILSAVGSLRPAAIRHAGRSRATVIDRDLELVALSGTLGCGGVHLHVAVADGRGVVRGGHLLEGSIVRTTVELVVGVAAGWRFDREMDPTTGYRELKVVVVERP